MDPYRKDNGKVQNHMRLWVSFFVLATFGLPSVGSPEVRSQGVGMTSEVATSEITALGVLIAETPTPTVIAGEEIVFAQVRFSQSLPLGSEIEIWPLAADSTAVDSTFGRNLWVVDARTGDEIRFDVTEVVRAWNENTLANYGFLIKVLETETSQAPQARLGTLKPLSTAPSSAILLWHTGPRRDITKVKTDHGSTPRLESSGH